MKHECPTCRVQLGPERTQLSGYALVGEYRGPCECGDPDARHRVYDAVAESLKAGEHPRSLAEDHSLPLENIITIASEVRP